MFCTLCVSQLASRRISESNNFISGTTSFQHDNLKLHVTKYELDSKNIDETAYRHSKDIDETVDEELQPLQPDMEDSADNNVVYITAPGFAAIAALDEQSFKDLIGFRFRKAGTLVRVAYKFDNGWQTGKWESVSDRATRAEVVLSEPAFPVHIVNFSKVRHQLQLSLASYGIDGKWCLVCEDECNYDEHLEKS